MDSKNPTCKFLRDDSCPHCGAALALLRRPGVPDQLLCPDCELNGAAADGAGMAFRPVEPELIAQVKRFYKVHRFSMRRVSGKPRVNAAASPVHNASHPAGAAMTLPFTEIAVKGLHDLD